MTNSRFSFRNIIIILLSVSILLLISHLILSFAYPGLNRQKFSTISNQELDKKFKKSLYSFAIKEEWIKPLKNDAKFISYRIKVPSDLPIPQILSEVIKQYEGFDLDIRSEEIRIHGRTLTQISAGDVIKLKADFRYDNTIQRTDIKSSLFIYGRENRESDYDLLMSNTTRDISALLLPSKSNSAYSSWLRENGFDYAIMLNNDINELEFKMEEDYSTRRLKLIVQNMVAAFPNALFYLIDKKSKIYSTPNFFVIKNEFDKRKIKFFTTDSVKIIDNTTPNPGERLDSIVKNIKKDDRTRIALDLDTYLSLEVELKKLIKIGYKFVKTSELESKENK
jgi:hypothetical protein